MDRSKNWNHSASLICNTSARDHANPVLLARAWRWPGRPVPRVSHALYAAIPDGTFILPRVPVGAHDVFVSRQGFKRRDLLAIDVLENTENDLGDVTIFSETGAYGVVRINGGAASTASLTVTVSIDASSDATVYMLSESPDFSDQTFAQIEASKAFTFAAEPGANESDLTLYAQFANSDNGLQTTTSTTIRYDDSQPPTPTISKVASPDNATN